VLEFIDAVANFFRTDGNTLQERQNIADSAVSAFDLAYP